jgi:hypothetical protein
VSASEPAFQADYGMRYGMGRCRHPPTASQAARLALMSAAIANCPLKPRVPRPDGAVMALMGGPMTGNRWSHARGNLPRLKWSHARGRRQDPGRRRPSCAWWSPSTVMANRSPVVSVTRAATPQLAAAGRP